MGRGAYTVLVGKVEIKTTQGRPRLRWEDDIKIDFQEIRCIRKVAVHLGYGTVRCSGLDTTSSPF
jgi:hypothetical protein